jgi:hypothetical protein
MKPEPCPSCGYPLYPQLTPIADRVTAHCHRCDKVFDRPDMKPISYAEWLAFKIEWDREAQDSKGQAFWMCVLLVASLLIPVLLQALGFWEWLDGI